MNLWSSRLANTNTRLSVKLELQKNNNVFYEYVPNSAQDILILKTISHLKFKFGSSIFFSATLDELNNWVLALSKTNCGYLLGDWSHP